MANAQETRRDLTAHVLKATKAEGKNGPYWEFDLVEQGQEKALTWRMFDANAGAEIEVGKTYLFKAGTKPTDRGGIFRNLYTAQTVAVGEIHPAPVVKSAPQVNGFKDYGAERISIERQKATAEGREAAQFLVRLYFDMRLEGQDWATFREAWELELQELTARFAKRLFQGIHGREEA